MKKILLIFVILLVGCVKPELPLPIPQITYVFDAKESKVTNGQDIYFKLPSTGI